MWNSSSKTMTFTFFFKDKSHLSVQKSEGPLASLISFVVNDNSTTSHQLYEQQEQLTTHVFIWRPCSYLNAKGVCEMVLLITSLTRVIFSVPVKPCFSKWSARFRKVRLSRYWQLLRMISKRCSYTHKHVFIHLYMWRLIDIKYFLAANII